MGEHIGKHPKMECSRVHSEAAEIKLREEVTNLGELDFRSGLVSLSCIGH